MSAPGDHQASGLKDSEWLLWLLAVAGNVLLTYVWCVFLSAAAGNANRGAREFVMLSVAAAAVPLVLSIFFIAKGKFSPAMLSICATLPMLVLAMFVA